jgi:hypothetical protein
MSALLTDEHQQRARGSGRTSSAHRRVDHRDATRASGVSDLLARERVHGRVNGDQAALFHPGQGALVTQDHRTNIVVVDHADSEEVACSTELDQG